MLETIVSTIICNTYELEFRKRDGQSEVKSECMQVSFSIPVDHDTEAGYRWLELRIMWTGYVGVFMRECADVIPIEGIDDENDCLKKGYEYTKSATKWRCLSCHDSCWRSDGVQRFMYDNAQRILHSKTSRFSHWYDRIDLTEREMDAFRTIEQERGIGT